MKNLIILRVVLNEKGIRLYERVGRSVKEITEYFLYPAAEKLTLDKAGDILFSKIGSDIIDYYEITKNYPLSRLVPESEITAGIWREIKCEEGYSGFTVELDERLVSQNPPFHYFDRFGVYVKNYDTAYYLTDANEEEKNRYTEYKEKKIVAGEIENYIINNRIKYPLMNLSLDELKWLKEKIKRDRT